MKSIISILVLFFSTVVVCQAEELSIMGGKNTPAQIENKEPQAPSKNVDDVNSGDESEIDTSVNVMKEYLDVERKKQDEINNLTRDIQKYSLELQRKELIQKINDIPNKINTSSSSILVQPASTDKNDPHVGFDTPINILYISVSKNFKEVLLQVEGTKVFATEGQLLSSGDTIKTINSDNIVLENKAGTFTTLMFNSMVL